MAQSSSQRRPLPIEAAPVEAASITRAPVGALPPAGAVPGRACEFHWDAPPPTPLLRSLLAYWDERRGAGTMPARSGLDPLHIPALLPRLMLLDVLREPLDFRYRLIGTGIVDRLSADHTGSLLSTLAWQCAPSPVFGFAAAVTTARRPAWAALPYIGPDLTAHAFTVLGLPLSENEGAVDMLLLGAEFGLLA